MRYVEGFLEKFGEACTILRSSPLSSFVTLERVSYSSDPASREATWHGLIPASTELSSGEFFTVGGDTYLVQLTRPVQDVLEFYAVKCNATLELQRPVEMDTDEELILAWEVIGTTNAWGQIVTAKLREADPGLVENARYVFQVPKSLGVQLMDRVVYDDNNYRVEAIDDIAMPGVVRIQLGVDFR